MAVAVSVLTSRAVACVSSGQCDDGNVCNGLELCQGDTCQAGSSAVAGTACQIDEQTAGVCSGLGSCGECGQLETVTTHFTSLQWSAPATSTAMTATTATERRPATIWAHVCRVVVCLWGPSVHSWATRLECAIPTKSAVRCVHECLALRRVENVCSDPTVPPVGCNEDLNCDDSNPCNGAETCLEGVCQSGAPPAVGESGGVCCVSVDTPC